MRESDYSLYLEQRKLADMITRHAELDDVRITLASGARANEAVVQGLHPLHYAVYEKYVECVKVVITWTVYESCKVSIRLWVPRRWEVLNSFETDEVKKV